MKNFRIYTSFLALLLSLTLVGQVDRTIIPKPGPAPEFKLGSSTTFTLSNGLKVIVVENHKVPTVSFQIALKYTPILEGNSAGYVTMAGNLLAAGTTNRSKAQIDEEIDFIGASFFTSSNGIFASSLTKHTDKLLNVVSDVLLNPTFPEAELEKLKKQELSGLQANQNDPNYISGNLSAVLNYGKNHPYGEVVTEETVKNITQAKCKNFYKSYFKANHAYLVVVGDIDPVTLRETINTYFGKWQRGEIPKSTLSAPEMPKNIQVAMVDRPSAVQSVINITYPVNLKPGSSDAIAASVMNNILGGGGFSSRMLQNIREDKGYTYGVSSRLSSDEYIGNFKCGGSVANAVSDSTIIEFLNEMQLIVNKGVTQKELTQMINKMTGEFALALESPRTVARFALNVEQYNLPKDYYSTYLQKLSKVTVEDVNAAALKYIKPSNCNIVVVGNKKEVSAKIQKFSGNNEVLYYDMYGNEVRERAVNVPKGVTAQTVIDGYLNAIGGAERLNQIKDMTMVSNANMQGVTFRIESFNKAENKSLSIMSMGGQEMQKEVFNGQKGYVQGMQGKIDLTPEEIKTKSYEALIVPELMYEKLNFKLNIISLDEINDIGVYIIEITPPNGDVYYDHFNAETFFKIKSVKNINGMRATTEFEDYQKTNYMMVPFTVNQSVGPQKLTIKVEEVKYNTGLEDKLFESN